MMQFTSKIKIHNSIYIDSKNRTFFRIVSFFRTLSSNDVDLPENASRALNVLGEDQVGLRSGNALTVHLSEQS